MESEKGKKKSQAKKLGGGYNWDLGSLVFGNRNNSGEKIEEDTESEEDDDWVEPKKKVVKVNPAPVPEPPPIILPPEPIKYSWVGEPVSRTCKICGKDLPIKNFYGRGTACKKCIRS